ncbi:MAG: VWA domain-containing protein [Stomatobaculum sp.]|nr:VWA domain-containing protein [Stomatobaculum sp.]
MSGKKGSFFRRFLTAVLVLILISGAGFAGLQIYRRITTRRQTLEALRELMDGEEDIRRWTDRAEERFSHYSLTEQEKESFDSLIIGGRSIGVRQYAEQGEYIRRIRKLEDAVVSRQDSIASREMERVGNTVPLYASEEKREKISGLQSEIDEKIADGKYKEAEEQLNELDSLMEEASRKKEGLNVAIEQYDYSAYPNVKLYVDVLDGQSGQPLLGLGTDAFYLREENSETGIYENRKVVNAVQMEGHAGLNIALAADVSSSMRTDNRIDGAKFVMQNFIAQVHFTEGDLVKMIPFSNHVRGNGYFSPDGPAVQREIAGYTADGGTALYDAILYSVQDVLRQPGAKCVVAFTDGHDEHSSTNPQDLINTVRYAGVPVYIVRVGGYTGSDANYDGVLRQIAESSGGSFRVVSNFNEDMSQFYAQIYHQIKQYYMLEYTDTGSSLFDARGVNVYVESGDRGGEDTKSVIPSDVLFSMCCDVTD